MQILYVPGELPNSLLQLEDLEPGLGQAHLCFLKFQPKQDKV